MANPMFIGRLGVQVALDGPEMWRHGQQDVINGTLLADTLANAIALRDELRAMAEAKIVVPVRWASDDPAPDEYFRILGANILTRKVTDRGWFPFDVTLERYGSEANVEFESLIAGTVLPNDFTVVDTETLPYHAPARGSFSYDADTTVPTELVRTGEGGAITVWEHDGAAADRTAAFTASRRWQVTPANYYTGSCKVTIGGRVLTGRHHVNDPDSWILENELVRVTPSVDGGSVSDGRLLVEHHDGTVFDTAKEYRIIHLTSVIPRWTSISVLRVDPEVCVVELIRDADTAPQTPHRHQLTLALRRGSRSVHCHYHWTGTATSLLVRRETAEAATAFSVTGGVGDIGVRATSNDGNSNRYVLACKNTTTKDLTNGGLEQLTTKDFDFVISSEIGGSAAVVGDQADQLGLQYLAGIYEQVRPARI